MCHCESTAFNRLWATHETRLVIHIVPQIVDSSAGRLTMFNTGSCSLKSDRQLKVTKKATWLPPKEIRQPDKNDKLLVLTAFENNPLFFSMAWNWIQICKVSLKDDVPGSW